MSKVPARRTQSQRREETREAVLNQAQRLFGKLGYDAASLDEIAASCGMTVRPIYHYFGSKIGLFQAVTERLEAQIEAQINSVDSDDPSVSILTSWQALMELCRNPEFRRIVLIDSPIVLGRSRWDEGPVKSRAMERLGEISGTERSRLRGRLIVGAMIEAALYVAEQDHTESAIEDATHLISQMMEISGDDG